MCVNNVYDIKCVDLLFISVCLSKNNDIKVGFSCLVFFLLHNFKVNTTNMSQYIWIYLGYYQLYDSEIVTFFYILRLHTLKSKGGGHDKHFVFEVNENKISLSNLCLVSMLRLWEYILHSFTIFLGLKTVYFSNLSTLRTRLEFWF